MSLDLKANCYGFANGWHKLYFPSARWRKHKKVGKHWFKLMNHDHRIQLLKLQITLDYVCVHTGVLQGWFLTNHLMFRKDLNHLCPTQMAYWAKNYVTISTRAAHWRRYEGRTMNGLLWSYQTKFSFSWCTDRVRILIAMVTDLVKKGHWGPPASKMSNSRLSK